MADRHPFEVAT